MARMVGRTRFKASSLVLDYTLYPRQEVNGYNVARLVQALEAGRELPPVVVDNKTRRVVDGFHRVKAYQRFQGADAWVPVEKHEYASEAELYADAVARNATHGMPLSSWDRARILGRGEELGLTRDAIAGALGLTRERLETVTEDRFAEFKGKPVALKRSTIHLAGHELTDEQERYLEKAGGNPQAFYVNQVIAMLEGDAVDWSQENLGLKLRRLMELLEATLRERATR